MNEQLTSINERHLHMYKIDTKGDGKTIMTLTNTGTPVENHIHQIYKFELEMDNGHNHTTPEYEENMRLEKERIDIIKHTRKLTTEERAKIRLMNRWNKILVEWKEVNPNCNPIHSNYLERKNKELWKLYNDEIIYDNYIENKQEEVI